LPVVRVFVELLLEIIFRRQNSSPELACGANTSLYKIVLMRAG
jgi:hypothetical protein